MPVMTHGYSTLWSPASLHSCTRWLQYFIKQTKGKSIYGLMTSRETSWGGVKNMDVDTEYWKCDHETNLYLKKCSAWELRELILLSSGSSWQPAGQHHVELFNWEAVYFVRNFTKYWASGLKW
jgi:hypothetical protein